MLVVFLCSARLVVHPYRWACSSNNPEVTVNTHAVALLARGSTMTYVVVTPSNANMIRRMGGKIVARDMNERQARIECAHRNKGR